MKTLKSILYAALFTAAAALAVSCSNSGKGHENHDHNESTETTEAKPHGEGKEYTSAYVCPMHCPGSGSDQAGKCPACGMDYVAQADHVKDEHSH